MGGRTFVDTNVLVYLFDHEEPAKRAKARQALEDLELGELVISTQVLQEFYATITRKRLLTPGEAARSMADLCRNPVVIVDPPMILGAASRSMSGSLDFWDALIVEAALSGDCDQLLTEDRGLLQGRAFGTLRVENPFAGA